MERYSEKYMETHSIDVFFKCGKCPIHVLTSGSIIPEGLNDILRNRTLQEMAELNGNRRNGQEGPNVSLNTQYIQTLINRHDSLVRELAQENQNIRFDELPLSPNVDQIVEHFSFYARQGFYSYDCEAVNEDGTAVYTLMVWPNNAFHMDLELPNFVPNGFEGNMNGDIPPEQIWM